MRLLQFFIFGSIFTLVNGSGNYAGYGEACDFETLCESGKNYDCVNGVCVCNHIYREYDSFQDKCSLKYQRNGCSVNNDCNQARNLVCSTGSGYCLCGGIRSDLAQYKWNGTACDSLFNDVVYPSYDYDCGVMYYGCDQHDMGPWRITAGTSICKCIEEPGIAHQKQTPFGIICECN
jgi:hypothetical protein